MSKHERLETIVENILSAADGPLSAADLWAKPFVREFAVFELELVQVLEELWRRGYLQRHSAEPAVWKYSWRALDKKPAKQNNPVKIDVEEPSTIARVETTHKGNEIVIRILIAPK